MNKLAKIFFLTTSLIVLISATLYGTHNRAGEITYVQTGPLTIVATVTTYTKTSSAGADRDSIEVFWGDGSSDVVFRSNGNGDELPSLDIKVNFYTMEHSYPSRNRYTISFQDPNRVNNIQNVNYPNSIDVPFYLETRITLTQTQFEGPNSSVMLLQPPIDFACVGSRFVHNPNAYDPDGDSISYQLVTPLQSQGTEVPNYVFPDGIPGATGNLSINSITGDLIWDTPTVTGEFNVAIQINEFRDGILVNSVIRDMQILVLPCTDNPPVIEVENEICVIAGTEIRLPVRVTDIDSGQQVRIFATGGPFMQDISPATVPNQNEYVDSPLETVFSWDTQCEHISDNFYQVVFRGQDNSDFRASGNSVLKSLRIKIVGPPPEELNTEVINEDEIKLTWAKPYACEETLDNFFTGFRVYRREGTSPLPQDDCDNGLEGKGYEVIKQLTLDSEGNRYAYVDEDLEKGTIYCYRVVAIFSDITASGNEFRLVESLPSEEVCAQLQQDIPLITEVSVTETSPTSGSISISSLKPLVPDFDTLLNPGPYRYSLLESTDGSVFAEVAQLTTDNFGSTTSISFQRTGLNTVDNQYYYQIDFFAEDLLYSNSEMASSVFASVISTDMLNLISCEEDVPWRNFLYDLELFDNNTNSYNLLDAAELCDFSHEMLVNDSEFCYRIRSTGTYGLRDNELLPNYSQRVCGTPVDSIGPCPPVTTVQNPCGAESGLDELDFINTIRWTPTTDCNIPEEAFSYRVYFSANRTSLDYELLTEVEADEILEIEHLPEVGISGCYTVSAVDSLGNEGRRGEPICVSNCPIYRLPNTFTPNGDGANDIFRPRQNQFVAAVNFQLFNRWGNLMYETTLPELNWDGTVSSGKEAPEGTYYYTCRVLESDLNGELSEVELLEGYIQLFR